MSPTWTLWTTRKAVSARSSSSHRMREADVVHPRAAVALGDRRAEEARARPSCAKISRWTSPFASHSRMCGRISRLGEGAGGLLDEPVLVGQGEVDHGSVRSLRGGAGRVGGRFYAVGRDPARLPDPCRPTTPISPRSPAAT